MFKKTVLVIFLVFLFFAVISSVAAADYYVGNSTKHSDITNWMKNDAKNGDNLVFTGSKYDLTDTIVVSKSINIKSENKTQINFKKENNMFNVIVSGVNFDGLSLNHNANGKESSLMVIYASGPFKKINIKNTDIKTNGYSVSAVNIHKWYGNITNCTIDVGNKFSGAVNSDGWTGSIINSKIIAGKGLETQGPSVIICIRGKWNGDIVNSEISSNSSCTIYSFSWSGKITGSKIYSNADKTQKWWLYGLFLPDSKGTITNCIIKLNSKYALGVSDEVKVSNCSLASDNKHINIYRLRPDLVIDSVKKSGTAYKVSFSNVGDTGSKPCTLVIKCGNKILKKVNVKSLEGVMEGPQKTIKLAIPAKYTNKKYTKTAIIDYYNKNKEYNKKNNRYNFKF